MTRTGTRGSASTRLDIEHLFDAGSRQNRTDVPVADVPRRRTRCPSDPAAKEPGMAMIRVEPVEVHVRTGWFDGSPREITWGDERLPSPGSPRSARRPPPTRSSPARGRCSRSRRRGRGSPSPTSIARGAGRSPPWTRSGAQPDRHCRSANAPSAGIVGSGGGRAGTVPAPRPAAAHAGPTAAPRAVAQPTIGSCQTPTAERRSAT